MAVLGRSRSGAPPDQILDPPLKYLRGEMRSQGGVKGEGLTSLGSSR